MKNGRTTKHPGAFRRMMAWAVLPLGVLSAADAWGADPALRVGGDGAVILEYFGDFAVEYPDVGVRYEVDGSLMFLLGCNANIDEHWNVGFDMGVGFTEFKPNRPIVPGEFDQDFLRGDGMIWRLRLSVDYNLLKGAVTPYVTGGIGMLAIVSEDEDEDWDWYYDDDDWWYYSPWGTPTNTELAFLFGAGAGVRWDISDAVYLKLGGRADWAVFPDARNPVLLPTGYLVVGLKF